MEKNQNPALVHLKAIKAIRPALRYDGSRPFTDWQKDARAKLIALTGLDKITPAADDCFSVEEVTEEETYTDYRILFQSEEGYFVPCHLWVPKGKEGKIPMVICLQGHSKGYHISMGKPIYPGDENTIAGGDRDFARQIIREGYCALAIEQRAFGECGGTPKGPACLLPAMAALLYGRTLIAERVFDISRAIDVVTANFPVVDAERIACMGNSGGGTATVYAAALDERIKVAMPSCAVCSFKYSIANVPHCTCNYIPGVAKYFDMGDLAILIAPKKLVVVSGTHDEIFPIQGVHNMFAIMQNLYAASGADGNCALVVGAEGHRFYADDAWPVMHRLLGRK